MGLVDKARVKQKFTQALENYNHNAFAQRKINQRLIEILMQTEQTYFNEILEIGCGTGLLSKLLRTNIRGKNWSFNDICDVREHLQNEFVKESFDFYLSDAENWDFAKKSYDLIVSASVIQWFNDPQLFIQRLTQHLNPQGILLLSSFSSENLKEIRTLTGIGLTYPNLQDWQQWLQKDYHILHLEQQKVCLSFSTPLAVLKHLKHTGVTGIVQHNWTKNRLNEFIKNYQKSYILKDTQVGLTYSPIFILAVKKEK